MMPFPDIRAAAQRLTAPQLIAVAGIGMILLGALGFIGLGGGRKATSELAQANGRIEVERVDVATKRAGRVAEVLLREGDAVEAGEVVARMDTAELEAQLAAARAAVSRSIAMIKRAEAEVSLRQAEHKLSGIELDRAAELERKQVSSTAELERRTAQHDIAAANLEAASAAVADAEAGRESALAQVRLIEVMIEDMTLKAPIRGRIEFRLVQPGSVLAAGARVASILDLSDVYMTVFLPTSQAGRVSMGAEARIVLDAAPQYVVPATVSFVASEAQFTPKTVETDNEREKLMYRVKLRIPAALLEKYREQVKAGLTGEAFVRLDPSLPWPDELETRLPDGSS